MAGSGTARRLHAPAGQGVAQRLEAGGKAEEWRRGQTSLQREVNVIASGSR
jgi:hypothetical protein